MFTSFKWQLCGWQDWWVANRGAGASLPPLIFLIIINVDDHRNQCWWSSWLYFIIKIIRPKYRPTLMIIEINVDFPDNNQCWWSSKSMLMIIMIMKTMLIWPSFWQFASPPAKMIIMTLFYNKDNKDNSFKISPNFDDNGCCHLSGFAPTRMQFHLSLPNQSLPR